MYRVLITLINGHSISTSLKSKEDVNELFNQASTQKKIIIKARTQDTTLIFCDKISCITVYKEKGEN